MNRWIGKVVLFASLSGTLAVASGGLALAEASDDAAPHEGGMHHGRGEGLLGQALKLDSLTSDQRAAVAELAASRRAAGVPVRQADAHVLTTLAQQVEAGAIDRAALAPSVQAKESAEASAHVTERDLATKLHALLTPAQRRQLVDAIEAGDHGSHGRGPGGRGAGELAHLSNRLGLSPVQVQQIEARLKAERQAAPKDGPRDGAGQARHHAWLESFRGDTFDSAPATLAGANAAMDRRGEHREHLIEAAVPFLTQAQRTELAGHLRERAARESHS